MRTVGKSISGKREEKGSEESEQACWEVEAHGWQAWVSGDMGVGVGVGVGESDICWNSQIYCGTVRLCSKSDGMKLESSVWAGRDGETEGGKAKRYRLGSGPHCKALSPSAHSNRLITENLLDCWLQLRWWHLKHGGDYDPQTSA
jgi:hypothetical protein